MTRLTASQIPRPRDNSTLILREYCPRLDYLIDAGQTALLLAAVSNLHSAFSVPLQHVLLIHQSIPRATVSFILLLIRGRIANSAMSSSTDSAV